MHKGSEMWSWLRISLAPKASSPKHLALELGGEIIALMEVDGIDYPWTYATLLDTAKFERFRPYFTDTESSLDEDAELEALCAEVQIKGGFRLRCLATNKVFIDLVMHQEGNIVWFRCHPEDDT